MINFNQLKLIRSDAYSFVGIKRENGVDKFYLPLGYDNLDNLGFDRVKELFFDFYKLFRKFGDMVVPNVKTKNQQK